jgi:phage baseplate assembly protein W
MIQGLLDPAKAFLGTGWNFPPQLAVDGTLAEVTQEEDVRQAILIILQTNPGERVMRPEFGAGLNQFVFEPANTTTMARIQQRVQESLVAFEPRIDVIEVTVTSEPDTRFVLQISMTYRVRGTNSLSNLVYPFYLQEGSR